jgi:hypothetical protein
MSRAVLLLIACCILVILLSLQGYRTEYHEFMQSIDRTVMGDDAESSAEMDLEAQGPSVRDNSDFPVPNLTPLDDLTSRKQSDAGY